LGSISHNLLEAGKKNPTGMILLWLWNSNRLNHF